ncbi:MAG: glycoside hydrolase family 31 protein, partial [Bacteroidales bacterium]|nr:glycoside hydrolase family 31 protein [Bacteroidales bacterium]
PQYCPEADDFKQHGWYLGGTCYDAYNEEARKLYWEYANETFFSHGFDAWWCDCTEPIDADWHQMPEGYGWNSHEERYQSSLEALGKLLGAERANTFSLFHSQGIYENQRAENNEKRVVNLTRSSYAGQQRFATITWNGDTHASWENFAQMIPAGLNFMATGCNYWTVDAGAFFTIKTPTWFYDGSFGWNKENKGWHEFYLRMLQFAEFLPVFRSHGTNLPREVWQFGQKGERIYDAIVECIGQRYRFLPYTYSLAHNVSANNYTMSRLLAFDFPKDKEVFDIKDEFMYGPSLLVKAITEPFFYQENGEIIPGNQKTVDLYLPKGASWYDFYSDLIFEGGTRLTTGAALMHLPLFVRAGSILPMGPVVEYAEQQSSLPLELHVYPGANASFELYDDAGDGYAYEEGEFSVIPLEWNDSERVLTMHSRVGSFAGMPLSREFEVVVHESAGVRKSASVVYEGSELRLNL